MPIRNSEIAGMFTDTADLLEINGKNPFRDRACRNAARTMKGLSRDITDMIADGRSLDDLPGIGSDLAGKIQTMVVEGSLPLLEQLKSDIPGYLTCLMKVGGTGTEKDQSALRGAGDIDQHMLIALMEPRPVYVASAEDDLHADPRGEYLSAYHASPVYELYGLTGLPAGTMPATDRTAAGTIGYHVRSGGHNVTDFDWAQYLDFADRHMKLCDTG